MSVDLRDLYQEIIMDHNRNPRNHHDMLDATTKAKGYNPMCGDKLTVFVKLDDDTIDAISFVGCGCAISQASASLMTEALCGKSLKQAHELYSKMHSMLTKDEVESVGHAKLDVLSGVKAYPARVKCATLAWHTMEAALEKEKATVCTE